MTPSQLKSLVDQQSASPDMSPLVGMQAPPDDTDLDDGDEDDDDDEPVDPLTKGTQLLSSWGEQGEALKEAAGELVDAAHEIGGDLLLSTVPEEAEEAVEDEYEGLPDDLQVCLAQHVADLAAGDVNALAAALVDGHDGDTETADQKLVATYITKLAALAKDEVDPEDFVKDEDEDEDDKEGDGDDSGEHEPVAAAAGTSASPTDAPSGPLG